MLDGAKDDMPDGLKEWFASGTQGASANSIVAHLTGHAEQRGCYPLDDGDFGRCERLLDMVPSLRAELPKMAEVNAYWAALVNSWHEIATSDDKRKMIRAIIDPIEKRDPGHVPFGEGVSLRFGKNDYQGSGTADDQPRMKETDADRDVKDRAYRVTANELRQFVERVERLEAEKRDIAEQQKEVMAEAKARGYDTKVMRKVIALRKRDKDDIAEEEAVLQMYMEALGM